jgi:hypothetical protein
MFQTGFGGGCNIFVLGIDGQMRGITGETNND